MAHKSSELVTGHDQPDPFLRTTKKGDAQLQDQDGFPDPITEESLKKFVLSESLPTDLSALVTIFVGLKDCQKEDVIMHSLNEEVNPKGVEKRLEVVGERNKEGLSFYEFAVAGDSRKSGSYDWSFFMRSTGYLKCFISAFLQQAKLKDCNVHTERPPTKVEFFNESILNDHFCTILEGLHSYFSNSQPNEDDSKLLEGLSAVNIWDIEKANKAVKLVLSMLAGTLKKSLVLLGHNLVEQVRKPNSKEHLELLRYAHLAKDDDADRPGASVGIGIVESSQTPTAEEVAELKAVLKNLVMRNAKEVGVEGCVREEPVIFDAKNTRNIKESIEKVAMKLSSKKPIPLSWIFLRSAFFKSGRLYVDIKELKEASRELEITDESFEEFLILFTATGSLIYNPRIQALEEYVVLNPADFCYSLNSLFKPRFDGDLKKGVVPLSYLTRIFGSDTHFFQEILVSSKHAIVVEMNRIEYRNESHPRPFPESLCFFIPIICENVQKVEKHASSLYLQVKSTFLPNNVGQILVERLLSHASVSLVPTEYSNVVSFEYKAGDGQDVVSFHVIFHADACELRVKSSDVMSSLAMDQTAWTTVQAVQSLLIDSCRSVKNSKKEAFVPFGTEVVGIGVMCASRGGFYSFPSTEEPPQECAAAVMDWKPIYDKLINDELNKHCTVTAEVLFKFGEQLYQKHIKSTSEEDVQKLMRALGQPQQRGISESIAATHLTGALLMYAASKDNSSFALYELLVGVNPEYGSAFCTYIAAQV